MAEEVEGVLEQLLTGLKDAVTGAVVGGEGVGRLTGGCPSSSRTTSSSRCSSAPRPAGTNSWHGSCLALAGSPAAASSSPRGSPRCSRA